MPPIGVAHGALVGEVGREERVVRPARRVEVDRGDVRDVELGEHVEQRGADAARAAGHDDAAAFIAERVRHGSSFLRFSSARRDVVSDTRPSSLVSTRYSTLPYGHCVTTLPVGDVK